MSSQETPPILNGGLTPNEKKSHTIFGGNEDTKGGDLRGRRKQESMS